MTAQLLELRASAADMCDEDLQGVVACQYGNLDDAERLYVRYRVDGAASAAQARKLVLLSKAITDRLDDHVVPYAQSLRARRPAIDRSEMIETVENIIKRARDKGNLNAEINAAKLLAELSGLNGGPESPLHDIKFRGTTSEIASDIFRKIGDGSLSTDDGAKLMKIVESAANLQIAQEIRAEEAARRSSTDSRDFHPPGTEAFKREQYLHQMREHLAKQKALTND